MPHCIFHYMFFLLFSGILPIFLADYLRRQEDTTRVKLFVAFMAAASLWSFAYLFQLLSVWPSEIFWFKVKFLGIVTLPVAWLSFALEYIGKKKWVSKRSITVLSIIPIFILVMIWTNDVHRLVFEDMVARNVGPFLTQIGVSGPLFWLHSVYSYALLLGGALILLWDLMKVGKVYLKQALILSIGVLVPLIGNAWYLSGFFVPNNFDVTLLFFPFAIVTFTWALSRYGFMDLIPIARELVFDRIEDPIIVLNDEDKVLDANESAKDAVREYFSSTRPDGLIGGEAKEIFSNVSRLVDTLQSGNEARIRIETEGGGGRYFFVKIDKIKDDREQLIGRVLVFQDITELEELKETEFIYTLLRQDLRSKYRNIQGHHQLLEETKLSEKQKKHLKKAIKISQEADEIIRMPKELREIKRTEWVAEKNIVKVLGNVVEEISDLAEREKVEIVENYPQNIGKVKGDYSLNALFTRILKTRIQTSKCDKIEIDAVEKENEILVKVEDNGKQLIEDCKNILGGEPYVGKSTGAGGIEYYMLREIAEHNNARIKVKDSELGGSRFEIGLKKA